MLGGEKPSNLISYPKVAVNVISVENLAILQESVVANEWVHFY